MTGEVVSSYLTFDGEVSLFVASGKTVESRIPEGGVGRDWKPMG